MDVKSDEPAGPASESGAEESIGQATLNPDGTLVLLLRAEGPDGGVGDAMFEYTPDHPQYQETLNHVGGLEAGQSKPVPPWPESTEESGNR